MLSVSSKGLEELDEAQTSPFTIFHHRDHFRIDSFLVPVAF
jgi:hypothetical protein